MKKAFTLSEVLIALGIVGIIAVLVIPGAMKDYKNKVYVSALQDTYAQLSNATLAAMTDEHADNFYETKSSGLSSCSDFNNGTCESGLGYFLINYMDAVKYNCGRGSDLCIAGASSDSYKTLSGANAGTPADKDCVQTAKGATVCGFYNPANSCTSILIDVNGKEGPNVTGRDVYVMDIKIDGSIADYGAGNVPGNIGCAASRCSTDGAGTLFDIACGCLTNVMEAGWRIKY